MKKPDAFHVRKRKEWERKSEKFRALFEKTADPQIIADFMSESTYALKAPWVTHALIQAFQDGRHDFLEKATSAVRDQRKNNMNVNAIKSLWTVIEVDRLVNSGMSKDKAFKQIVNHRLNRATDIRRNEASDRGLKRGFGPLIHSADFTSFRERVLCSLTAGTAVLGCARASR